MVLSIATQKIFCQTCKIAATGFENHGLVSPAFLGCTELIQLFQAIFVFLLFVGEPDLCQLHRIIIINFQCLSPPFAYISSLHKLVPMTSCSYHRFPFSISSKINPRQSKMPEKPLLKYHSKKQTALVRLLESCHVRSRYRE